MHSLRIDPISRSECHFAKVSGKTSGGLECRSTEPGGQKSRHKLDRGVGTTKRSIATMPSAWLRRNVFHPWREGPFSAPYTWDAGLADLDTELEKLSMDSRRSPQR